MLRQVVVSLLLLSSATVASGRPAPTPQRSAVENIRVGDSTFLQRLTLNDGSTLIGRITEFDSTTIDFQMTSGKISISRYVVVKYEELPQNRVRSGEYWFVNPNRTRLFFAPTARMLPKGSGYFADYYLFFPVVAWGISDNVSLGGGMSLLPGVNISQQVKYVIPKIGIAADSNVFLATGAVIASIPDDFDGSDRIAAGFMYGMMTLGSDDNSFTAGIGYGFIDGDWAENPAVVLGGEVRLSRRTAFVSENWVLGNDAESVFSGGIRFFGESLSVDLALIYPTTADDLEFPIPYVDFVYNF